MLPGKKYTPEDLLHDCLALSLGCSSLPLSVCLIGGDALRVLAARALSVVGADPGRAAARAGKLRPSDRHREDRGPARIGQAVDPEPDASSKSIILEFDLYPRAAQERV